MVEMLGVLAIIGILSVEAIAGYSKAMLKYKLNKQAQQITDILAITRTYLGKFPPKETYTYITPYFITLGLIPENMLKKNSTHTLQDAIGNNIEIHVGPDANHTYVNLYKQKSSTQQMTEKDRVQCIQTCLQSILAAKEYANDTQFQYIYLQSTSHDTIYIYGPNYCKSSVNCLKTLSVANILSICQEIIETTFDMFIIFKN